MEKSEEAQFVSKHDSDFSEQLGALYGEDLPIPSHLTHYFDYALYGDSIALDGYKIETDYGFYFLSY